MPSFLLKETSCFKKKLLTIPSGDGFLEQLAVGLLALDPLQRSKTVLLLPTQRAGLSFCEKMCDIGGGTTFLPRLFYLSNLTSLLKNTSPHTFINTPLMHTPLMGEVERLGLLVQLIREKHEALHEQFSHLGDVSFPLLLKLAHDFAHLLDTAETLEIDLSAIHHLPAHEFAHHWVLSKEFLTILSDLWPLILTEKGVMPPYRRENIATHTLIQHFQKAPPQSRIIIAGSTGSTPRIRRLMQAVLNLPQGYVILPGVDNVLLESLGTDHPSCAHNTIQPTAIKTTALKTTDARAALYNLEPPHPQYMLWYLLKEIGARPALFTASTFSGDTHADLSFNIRNPKAESCDKKISYLRRQLLRETFWPHTLELPTPHPLTLKKEKATPKEKEVSREENTSKEEANRVLQGLEWAEVENKETEALVIALGLKRFFNAHAFSPTSTDPDRSQHKESPATQKAEKAPAHSNAALDTPLNAAPIKRPKAIVIMPDKSLIPLLKKHLERMGLWFDAAGTVHLSTHPLSRLIKSILHYAANLDDAGAFLDLIKNPLVGFWRHNRSFSEKSKAKLINLIEATLLRSDTPLDCTLLSLIKRAKASAFAFKLAPLLKAFSWAFAPFFDLVKSDRPGANAAHAPSVWIEAFEEVMSHLTGLSLNVFSEISQEKDATSLLFKNSVYQKLLTPVPKTLSSDDQILYKQHQETLFEQGARTFTEILYTFNLQSEAFGPLTLDAFSALFHHQLNGKTYGLSRGLCAIEIWGTLDVRYASADFLILSGLNDTHWPGTMAENPWLNLKMREHLGLDDTLKQHALAAHDFCEALCHPRLLLTRHKRAQGCDMLPSRFLLALKRTLNDKGLSLPLSSLTQSAIRYNHPERTHQERPPLADPPLHKRPRLLFPTGIELLRRNPYGFYARSILKLRPLKPLGGEFSAAFWGTLFHAVLEDYGRAVHALKTQKLNNTKYSSDQKEEPFFNITPTPNKGLTPSPSAALSDVDFFLQFAKKALDPWRAHVVSYTFMWQKMVSLAPFVTKAFWKLPSHTTSLFESQGTLCLDTSFGAFTLKARADRIDVLPMNADHPQSGLSLNISQNLKTPQRHTVLIDYKTGQPPLEGDVSAGFSPQLPLEALLCLYDGFAPSTTKEPHLNLEKKVRNDTVLPEDTHTSFDLCYWHLTHQGVTCHTLKNPIDKLQEAHAHLYATLDFYYNKKAPYVAEPYPSKTPTYNDYAHLARTQAWRF